ncbi:MAG: hypothetical protein U1F43_37855 [Myxococcota bacterium]
MIGDRTVVGRREPHGLLVLGVEVPLYTCTDGGSVVLEAALARALGRTVADIVASDDNTSRRTIWARDLQRLTTCRTLPWARAAASLAAARQLRAGPGPRGAA